MSLKDKCETAVLALLKARPLLQGCYPKKSITTEAGQDFPCLWVRAQKPAKIAPETPIYKTPVQIVLETQFDDPDNDKLFAEIEDVAQEHTMIEPINTGNFQIHCFDNIGGDDAETVNPNFRSQTCALTLVCCET